VQRAAVVKEDELLAKFEELVLDVFSPVVFVMTLTSALDSAAWGCFIRAKR
jgi:hypothetical protein